jgi:hypothetical protein
MHRRAVGSLVLVGLCAAGCIVPENAKPDVSLGATFATKFVERGMTLVDNPVIQPKVQVAIPVVTGDTIGLSAEGNMDLRNDTGGAWFPDGHAGHFTQTELDLNYARKVDNVTLIGGLHSYNPSNGLEFPNGERGPTSEVFFVVTADVLEARPYFEIHYDFDEVRGAYYRGGCSEDIPIGRELVPGTQQPRWLVALDGSLGYVSEAQASWMYGIARAGWADLRGEAVLKYKYDPRTEISAGIHGSLIVDKTIDRWFDQLGIDSTPIWLTIGVGWAF